MKIWLNDLKKGDIFYHIIFNNVFKCEHLGDAHNMNFRMNRIKFKIIDENIEDLKDLLGYDHEAFVNQYVYNDKESCKEALKEKLKNDLQNTELVINKENTYLNDLKLRKKLIKKTLNEAI